MSSRKWCNTEEPGIEEMLQDPMVRLVMARDGLSAADLRAVLESAASRLDPRRHPGAGAASGLRQAV